MDFGKLAELSVGLAAAIGVLFIVLQIIKVLRQGTNGNGKNGNRSGERSVEEWEGRMRKLNEESNENLMNDIRQLLDARNERIREIVREEIEVIRRKGR